MARVPGLVRRKDRKYAIRVRVPAECKAALNKSEVWVSLSTHDPAEAKRKYPAAYAKVQAMFEDARQGAKPPARATSEDLLALTLEHYRDSLATDRRMRAAEFAGRTPDYAAMGRKVSQEVRGLYQAGVEVAQDSPLAGKPRPPATADDVERERTVYGYAEQSRFWTSPESEQELRRHLANHGTALVEDLAESQFQQKGLASRDGLGDFTPEFTEHCRNLLRVELELLKRYRERAEGKEDSKPADPILREAIIATTRGPKLSEVIQKFTDSKRVSGDWDEKTQVIFGGRLQTCLELLGDKPIEGYTTDEMEAFCVDVQKVPASFRSRATKMTAREAIAIESSGRVLSTSTANLHIDIIKSVFIYATKKKRYIRDNPTDAISKQKKDGTNRKPFTNEDLQLIFSNPEKRATTMPSYHWVPRIMLFTGARVEEVCQLQVEDIRQEHGIWVFDINREGSKRLKTEDSERLVPIHSELIRMGLLEFVAKQEGHIFSELPFGKNGYSTSYVKNMGRHIRKIGITDPLKVANHSYRNTMATRLASADVSETIRDRLQGWTGDSNAMRNRYTGPLEMQSLKDAIEKFKAIRID